MWKPSTPSIAILPLLTALLAGTGCSTFRSYPGTMEEATANYRRGAYEEAYTELEERASDHLDAIAYNAELGMIAHTRGEFQKSNEHLAAAEARAEAFDQEALVDLSSTTGDLGSLLVNEKVKAYRGEGYEKVLFNTYMALNHLMMGDLEGARVEVRRAYLRQQEVQQQHGRELEAWRAKSDRQAAAGLPQEVRQAYGNDLQSLAGVANAYENAFTFYLSSVIFELNGEPGLAYPNLREAYRLRPNASCIQRDLLRLSRSPETPDEYETWAAKFPQSLQAEPPENSVDLIFFFQSGLAPVKEEIKIVLPVPLGDTFTTIPAAFPRYVPRPNAVSGAQMVLENQTLGRTDELADIEKLALQSLTDRVPILVTKQVIRSAGKAVLAAQAHREGGALGAIAATIWNIVSEQADLRSWTLLPDSIQAFRTTVPRGTQGVKVKTLGAGGNILNTVDIKIPGEAEKTILVNLRAVDGSWAYHVVEY